MSLERSTLGPPRSTLTAGPGSRTMMTPKEHAHFWDSKDFRKEVSPLPPPDARVEAGWNPKSPNLVHINPAVTLAPQPTPLTPDELYIEVCFWGALVAAILKEARAADRRPIDLVADVIEAVFLNDLVRAVLDE